MLCNFHIQDKTHKNVLMRREDVTLNPIRYETIKSMRPLVHSTGQLLWTDVGLSSTGKKGPRHEIVPRSTAARAVSDVLALAADPTGLVATDRETILIKKQHRIHHSRRLTIHVLKRQMNSSQQRPATHQVTKAIQLHFSDRLDMAL